MDAAVSMLGAAQIDNVYHLAFLVEDIPTGMERYGRIFQCEWLEPGHTTYPGTGDARHPVTYTYSAGGPPFIELQVGNDDPGCVFGFSHSGGRPGFHHFGVYAERWRDETKRLQELGMDVLMDGNGMAHLEHPEAGFGIEVVSWKGRSFIHNYMKANGIDLLARAALAANAGS